MNSESNTPRANKDRTGLIAAGVIAAIILGVGGYFLQGKLKCDRYEEDYVNSVADMYQTAVIGTLLPSDPKDAAERASLQKAQLQIQEVRLNQIYSDCGRRAGQAAARRALSSFPGH